MACVWLCPCHKVESSPPEARRRGTHTGLRLSVKIKCSQCLSSASAPLWRPVPRRPSVSASLWDASACPSPPMLPGPCPCRAPPGSAAGRARAPHAEQLLVIPEFWQAPQLLRWLSRTVRSRALSLAQGSLGPGAPAAPPGRRCARPSGPAATGPGTGWHPQRPGGFSDGQLLPPLFLVLPAIPERTISRGRGWLLQPREETLWDIAAGVHRISTALLNYCTFGKLFF